MHGVESTEIIMTHALMWFRQDLRCADNRALFAACESKDTAVTALYCITPEQWIEHDVAGVRVDFERRHLAELQRDLDALNIPLVIIQAPRYADLPERIAALVQSSGISVLHANRQYEIHEQRRDSAVKDALSDLGIDCHWHEDLCILPPGSVQTQDRRYYTVFYAVLNATGWFSFTSNPYDYSPYRKLAFSVLACQTSFRINGVACPTLSVQRPQKPYGQ